MLHYYPKLDPVAVDRQEKHFLFCDAEGCDAEVEITDIREETKQVGPDTIISRVAEIPEGWDSSDPNPLKGSADFCPEHTHLLPPKPEDVQQTEDQVITDEA